jgi:hypothetical protein
LVQLANDTALEIAKQKKDYVTFDSANEALNFSKDLYLKQQVQQGKIIRG